jgi:hypothetical protein
LDTGPWAQIRERGGMSPAALYTQRRRKNDYILRPARKVYGEISSI